MLSTIVNLLLLLLLGCMMTQDTGTIGVAAWAFIVWQLFSSWKSKQKLTWHPLDTAVLLFACSACISAAWSSWPTESLKGLLKFLTMSGAYVGFRYWFSVHEKTARKAPVQQALQVFTVLALAGAAQSFIGFYQYVNHIAPQATWQDPTLNPELQLTRIFGLLKPNNPNLLAGFLVPCCASALTAMALCSRLGKRFWLLAVCASACAGALVLTGSRGGYLALVTLLSGAAYYGHIHRHRMPQALRESLQTWLLRLGILGVLLGGAVLLGSEALRHRLLSIGAMQADSSIAYRFHVYRSAVLMACDNWLVGIGPGNDVFKQVYGLYMTSGYNALGAYSVPLEIWVEQGLLGILAFLWILRQALHSTGRRVEKATQIISCGAMLALLASMAYGLFDTIWYRPAVNLLFWLLLALLASISSVQEPTDAPPVTPS